ncbi:MAG: PQQ-binding-like beta-propeller repeat protein, partial [Candidatus Hydrogenedentes bacterium]|nr:PQQ-binding-like beta-propeller repeat protein [Candidatus Hydrogenedentota bacterium]
VCAAAALFLSALCAAPGASADDWPTYAHDAARSAATAEQLALPLHEAWVHASRHAPRPAWPAPAKQDFWHRIRELRPIVTYDRAYHTAVAGGVVYFGSSADDKVYALDAGTGEVRWTFFTGGPIRLAPTIADGRAYVGSDDGCVYCLDAADGALIWRRRLAPTDHRVPGNGRIMSMFPVRTGVLVEGDTAYCFAGLFPSQGVYGYALDAADGSIRWEQTSPELSPQGYLLASPSRLFVPTGRTTPAMFERATGTFLGTLPGQGGAYALLAGDTLLSGPGRSTGQLDLTEPAAKEGVATFDGLRMVVRGDLAYLHSKTELSCLDRARNVELSKQRNPVIRRRDELKKQIEALAGGAEAPEAAPLNTELARLEEEIAGLTADMNACYRWRRPCELPYTLILAGDILFAGGDDEVAAYAANDGAPLWAAEVSGRAYGLAVAGGRLFVSTDSGSIHCFAQAGIEPQPAALAAAAAAPYPKDEWTAVYAREAMRVVDEAGTDKGYCVVLDCGEGRLACELAKVSQFQVIGIERDPAKVAVARTALDAAGLYGVRVTVHQAGAPGWPDNGLPYTSYFANLVVSGQALTGDALPEFPAEVWRMLRPFGGVASIGQSLEAARLGAELKTADVEQWIEASGASNARLIRQGGLWAAFRRGDVPGGGTWTQLYADASHTACSTDDLHGPMTIQWFGQPGPRDIIDRHHRPMSPLARDGRVFVPANDLVIALDAYNGTELWRLAVPNSRRTGALKNSGNMLLTDEYVYAITQDECWAVDVDSGTLEQVLKAPAPDPGQYEWGYLNRLDSRLYGTLQRPDASFSRLDRSTCSVLEGDFRPVIVSDALFAVDRHTGDHLWTYEGGTFMNNAIAIGEGAAGACVYAVVSRNEKALSNNDGRMRIDEFCKSDTFLVAVDAATGVTRWEVPFHFPYQHIMFLSFAQDTIL